MHDLSSTDKNRPTVNPNGPIYAVSAGHGSLVVLDPRTNSADEIEIPTRAPRAEVPSRFPRPNRPSLWWGDTHLWANPPYNPADPHNPMLDSKGRVWMTSKIRPNADPSWCYDPANKFAAWFPLRNSGRQASYFDPKTKQFVLIDTCYATHHLQFDNDANETVYFNELSRSDRRLDRHQGVRRDEGRAEGRRLVRTGRRYQRRRQASRLRHGIASPARGESIPLLGRHDGRASAGGRPAGAGPGGRAQAGGPDPKLDTLVSFSLYGVVPSPVDDSVWGVAERLSGLSRSRRSRQEPAAVVHDRDLQGARAGLRSARRGHRHQRRRVDRARREQPSGQLRSPQVQGDHRPAQG